MLPIFRRLSGGTGAVAAPHHPHGGRAPSKTAFEGYVSGPLISWHFHATLNSAAPQELTADTTPFEDACGYQMQYDFTLTDPKEGG